MEKHNRSRRFQRGRLEDLAGMDQRLIKAARRHYSRLQQRMARVEHHQPELFNVA